MKHDDKLNPAPQPHPAADEAAKPAPATAQTTPATEENPGRNYLVALLISYLLGFVGADRFYLGKNGTAVLKLLTFGGLTVWTHVDLLLIALGKLKAKGDDRPLEGYAQNHSWAKIVAIILTAFYFLSIAFFLAAFTFATVKGIRDRAEYYNDTGHYYDDSRPNNRPMFNSSIQ